MKRNRSWTRRLLQWVMSAGTHRRTPASTHALHSTHANMERERDFDAMVQRLRDVGGL